MDDPLARLFPRNGNPMGDAPELLNGITSGPGNQGSANTAMNQGHAGTGLGRLGVPMQLKAGGTTIGVGP